MICLVLFKKYEIVVSINVTLLFACYLQQHFFIDAKIDR